MYGAGYADKMAAVRQLALLALLGTTVITGAACATRGAVPRPFPGAAMPPAEAPVAAERPVPPGEPVVAAPPPTLDAAGDPIVPEPPLPPPAIVSTVLSLMGIPYRNGGSDLGGFDCSGLVQWVFARHGSALPREVREQYHAGLDVSRDELRPGDLVFFRTVNRSASHVGIVVGSGTFVHAPNSRGYVRMERLSASYWSKRFVGARRVPVASSTSARAE